MLERKPIVKVIVFASPAPIDVREAVDTLEMFASDSEDATDVLGVKEPGRLSWSLLQ